MPRRTKNNFSTWSSGASNSTLHKGEGERDGSVSEDVVEGECVGDSDSVAGEAVDPVDEGDVDEVGGVGEAAQRHPAGPVQQPIHRTAHTLPQRTTLSSNNT